MLGFLVECKAFRCLAEPNGSGTLGCWQHLSHDKCFRWIRIAFKNKLMAAESIPHLTNLPKSRTRQSFFPYSSSSLINILSVTAWALSHKSSPERTYYYCSARVDIKNKHHYSYYSYFLRPELSQIVCKYCPYQPKYVPLSNLSLKHLLLHLAFFY